MSHVENKTVSEQVGLQGVGKEMADDAVRRLENLVNRINPSQLFVACATAAMFGFGDQEPLYAKIERLAYAIYPLPPDDPSLDPVTFRDVEEGNDLASRLLTGQSFSAMPGIETDPELSKILARVTGNVQSVRGRAYADQTIRRIREAQGRFDSWFESRIGLSPTRAILLLRSTLQLHEDRFNDRALPFAREVGSSLKSNYLDARKTKKRDRSDDEKNILRQFRSAREAERHGRGVAFGTAVYENVPICHADLTDSVSQTEWDGLIGLLGFDAKVRANLTEPVSVRGVDSKLVEIGYRKGFLSAIV